MQPDGAQRFGGGDNGWTDPRPYHDDDRGEGAGVEMRTQFDPFCDRRGWDAWNNDASSIESAGGGVPGPAPLPTEGAVVALDKSLGHEDEDEEKEEEDENEEAEELLIVDI